MAQVPTRRESSAGGVVYRRPEPDRVEVALVATHGGERWGLPKGWIEAGESPEAAAMREVREEAGLVARVVEALDRIEYWFRWKQGSSPILVHKQVDFFLMEALDGDVAAHDHEVDEVRWFALDEAVERATYSGERQVLEKARDRLRAGA